MSNPLPFGRLLGTRESNFIYIYRRVPLDKIAPKFDLLKTINLHPDVVTLLTTCKNTEDLCLKKILFLDIETTGLYAGPDDCALLIGLGFFGNTHFHIEQFFMRDYRDEVASLNALLQRWRYFTHITGYNVKAFDFNFLNKRLIYNRIPPPSHFDFIDLLVAVRRFFRGRLENCSLSSVEKTVLKRERKDDLPSSLIPEYWCNFLETGKVEYAWKILQHNARDMMSTLYLFLWFFLRCRRPYGYCFSNIEDRISMLDLLAKHKRISDLKESLEFLLRTEKNEEMKEILLERYRKIYQNI